MLNLLISNTNSQIDFGVPKSLMGIGHKVAPLSCASPHVPNSTPDHPLSYSPFAKWVWIPTKICALCEIISPLTQNTKWDLSQYATTFLPASLPWPFLVINSPDPDIDGVLPCSEKSLRYKAFHLAGGFSLVICYQGTNEAQSLTK